MADPFQEPPVRAAIEAIWAKFPPGIVDLCNSLATRLATEEDREVFAELSRIGRELYAETRAAAPAMEEETLRVIVIAFSERVRHCIREIRERGTA